MKSVTGTVVVVQENRFRLVTDEGQARLFVLAYDADIEAQDLPELQRDQARIRVEYTSSDQWIADIAHRLMEASADHPERGARS